MRRRGAPADDAGDARPVPRRKALSDALKNLDVYSNHKVAAEFTEKTPASDSRSTALTRTAWILMAVLLLAERASRRPVEAPGPKTPGGAR
jgi:hypothetical protein